MNAHLMLFAQRGTFEQTKLHSKVAEIKQEVLKTKDEEPEKVKPKMQDILDCVEAKDAKLAKELAIRYIESFKQNEYVYKFE